MTQYFSFLIEAIVYFLEPTRRQFSKVEERLVTEHFSKHNAQETTPSLMDCKIFISCYPEIQIEKKHIQDKVKNIIKFK